jgi:hypothetical protein
MHMSTSGNALLLTFIRWPSELPIPSSALPASGSLGIISARNIKGTPCADSHQHGAKLCIENLQLQIILTSY